MYKCPSCGGEMEFSPEKQKLVCPYCGREYDPEEFESAKTVTAEEYNEPVSEDESSGETITATIFTCPQCGGEIFSTEETAATFCSFCGSSVLLESRVSKERKPEKIIPFRISREECEKIYRQRISKSWFVPGEMKKQETIEKFRGIYMPFWSYEIYGENRMKGLKGIKMHREGSYDVTETYSIDLDAVCHYNGLLYDASSTFPDDVADTILPYGIKNQAKDWQSSYLTGFYADTGDIPSDVYESDARENVDRMFELAIQSKLSSYRSVSFDNSGAEYTGEKPKFLFLPVWFLSSRNKKTGRVSYAVINGENGKIAADLPIDFKKYLLLSLLIAILAFFLFYIPTIIPRTLVFITLVLAFVMLFLVNQSCNRAYTKEHGGFDKGRLFKEPDLAARTRIRPNSKEKKQAAKKKLNSAITLLLFLGLIAVSVFLSVKVGSTTLGGFLVFGGAVLYTVVLTKIGNALKKKELDKEIVYPAPWKIKAPTLLKPLAGIVLCLAILLFAPAHDAWYYGASALNSILLCLSVLDLVRNHNILVTRKPVQLGKRGGDENA